MIEWFTGLNLPAKTVAIAVIGPVAGAFVGGIIKWLLDRRIIRELTEQRSAADRDRKAATDSREIALRERETALHQLYQREAENQQRQRQLDELQRIVDGRATDLADQESRLGRLIETLRGNETGLWTTFPRQPPLPDFDSRIGRGSPVIIVVANNKGGVGKTTLVGNLLAYFDRKLEKRVLAIDLDYQGSLSTMLRAEPATADSRTSNVNTLLARDAGLGSLYKATRGLGSRLSRSELASAFYELALFEDHLMVEWLLQEGGDDVRYRLANVLLQDGIQRKFDIVLIDVPPRLTTGTINALCTSTHVLVPTIFNPIAAEPVANFIATTTALMDHLNPKLEFLGVVETLAPRANEGQDTRAEGRRVIEETLKRSFPLIRILENNVPRRTAIAGGGVAYIDDRDVRDIFNPLGKEIAEKVGL